MRRVRTTGWYICDSLPRTALICGLAYGSVLITNAQYFRRACYSILTELRSRHDLVLSLLTMLRSVRSGLSGMSASLCARRDKDRKGLASTIDSRNQIEAIEWRIGCGIDEISDSAGGMVYPCIGCDASLSGERKRVVCSGCDCNVRVDQLCIRQRRWCVLNPYQHGIVALSG